MIKALFFDLDGTLLTSDKRISPATAAALRRCREKGIGVFVATARPPLLERMLGLTPEEAELIGDGGVFYNGGCVTCNGRKHYTTLPPGVAEDCIRRITAHPEVNLAVQMVDEVHSFRYALAAPGHAVWGVDREANLPFNALRYDAVVKLVVFSPHRALPGLRAELAQLLDGGANVYLTGSTGFRAVEVVAGSVNKKLAIDRIAGMMGIGDDELAVFGDDSNDIEMLRGFRHSVAMGNAGEAVKAAARYVTSGNDADGIPHALAGILGVI